MLFRKHKTSTKDYTIHETINKLTQQKEVTDYITQLRN